MSATRVSEMLKSVDLFRPTLFDWYTDCDFDQVSEHSSIWAGHTYYYRFT